MLCCNSISTWVIAHGTDMLTVPVYFIQETTDCVQYVTRVFMDSCSPVFQGAELNIACQGWQL